MISFDWDEANVRHIARHGVTPEEAEEVMYNLYLLDDGYYYVDDEFRQAQVGPTRRGRFLRVVWILREQHVRVVTAYDASRTAVRLYNDLFSG